MTRGVSPTISVSIATRSRRRCLAATVLSPLDFIFCGTTFRTQDGKTLAGLRLWEGLSNERRP
jgi:hypothetical protein